MTNMVSCVYNRSTIYYSVSCVYCTTSYNSVGCVYYLLSCVQVGTVYIRSVVSTTPSVVYINRLVVYNSLLIDWSVVTSVQEDILPEFFFSSINGAFE